MQKIQIYNEEQKQEYINYEKTNQETLIRYFKRISIKEREYNKDVANMNVDELMDTIASLNIRREESRGHLISLLRGYCNWAMLNNKTVNNEAINMISPESINSQESIQNKMIKDPKHLQSILNNTLDYICYENRSVRSALVIWLLYYGVPLEELPMLKKNSIDYHGKVIISPNGRKYKINDEISNLWLKCSQMTYIEKKNGKANDSKNKSVQEYTLYELVNNDYLFRPIKGNKIGDHEKFKLSVFRSIISNIFQGVPARNLNYSGVFYRLYLLELEGVDITPEIIAEYLWIEYVDRTDMFIKTRKWRIDYEDWKLAFGYHQ